MEIETREEGLEAERRARLLAEEAEWRASFRAEEELRARNRAEAKAAFESGYEEEDVQGEDAEWILDPYAFQAKEFRETWNARLFGPFEDTTNIPRMRFTDKKPERCHCVLPRTTLQIFSVEVSRIKKDLQWPLHVYGMVALRDSIDVKRNIIFHRTRDNCQILTQEVSFLKLIGPSRAVALIDPVIFEVDLKVKGSTTESEDKHLSFLAVRFMTSIPMRSCLLKRGYASKLSTMRFTLGLLVGSLEATIAVRVARGSWPDGCRAQFAVRTASICGEEAILLDSEDSKVPVDDDGSIMLSRCVACVELKGELRVSVKTWKGADNVANDEEVFKPKEADRSYGTLDVGFCQMDVTVFWSLISSL